MSEWNGKRERNGAGRQNEPFVIDPFFFCESSDWKKAVPNVRMHSSQRSRFGSTLSIPFIDRLFYLHPFDLSNLKMSFFFNIFLLDCRWMVEMVP